MWMLGVSALLCAGLIAFCAHVKRHRFGGGRACKVMRLCCTLSQADHPEYLEHTHGVAEVNNVEGVVHLLLRNHLTRLGTDSLRPPCGSSRERRASGGAAGQTMQAATACDPSLPSVRIAQSNLCLSPLCRWAALSSASTAAAATLPVALYCQERSRRMSLPAGPRSTGSTNVSRATTSCGSPLTPTREDMPP